MAVGDDAQAAGFPLVPDTGSDDALVKNGAREINRTRDIIAQVKSLIFSVWPITQGGTGATTAAQARTNLDVPSTSHVHDERYYTEAQINSQLANKANVPATGPRAVGDVTGANHMGLRWNGSRPVVRVDTTEWELARISDINGKADQYLASDQVKAAWGTREAHNREAGSDRYAVWVDGGKQFGRAVSSIKYKDDVRDWVIDIQKVLKLRPRSFHYKVDPEGVRSVGMIAEETHELLPEIIQWRTNPDTGEREIDGIHYEQLSVALLAVVQDQEVRIRALEERYEG